MACLPVQSEGPLRASGCSPVEIPPRAPPGFPQSHSRGQEGDSLGCALPTLLSLSLLDGDENIFTSPLVTGFLGGPQSSLQGGPWKEYAVSTLQLQAKCDLEDLG